MLTALCSCHHDDDEPDEKKAKKTVLVYMAAENNLSSFATEDLKEMMTGSLSLANDQNLIVYVDKANSQTSPFLARVKDGELVDTVFMQEGLAADPSVLERTIRYTREHFPAEVYGLVMWGHASGWLVSNSDSISQAESRAYGGSTGDNTSYGSGKYWMNIVPMAQAIANGMGNNKLQFIFGDCCSFCCMEVAYELRQVTDYVIGSPAEIPDKGAPFDKVIPDLFMESGRFYENVLDDYFDYYLDLYKERPSSYYNLNEGDLIGYSVPLVAIYTGELENFASATAKILNTISDKVSTTGNLNIDGALYYATYGSYRYSYDMYYVFKKNASTEDFNNWHNAYLQVIPYSLYSKQWMTNSRKLMVDMILFDADESDCGIVSMFFPSDSYSTTNPNWNKAIQQYQWNNVIRWEQYGW